jgi:membrane protein implicated in regulation of membrane protease activity
VDTLSGIEAIIRDLLIFVVAMSALLVGFLVTVSRMPDDNPLKRIMIALSYRIGATAAAGMIAIPATPIPGLDAIIDIGAPIALLWYWYTFVRDLLRDRRARSTAASRAGTPNQR